MEHTPAVQILMPLADRKRALPILAKRIDGDLYERVGTVEGTAAREDWLFRSLRFRCAVRQIDGMHGLTAIEAA